MIINDSFKKLIPPLTPDEYAQLEANCLADGIRDPLVVWQGVLIDGHNRLAIAEKHGLDYTVVEKEFEDENHVKIWMIRNQKGRRNLTDGWKYMLAETEKTIQMEIGAAVRKATEGRPKQAESVDENQEKLLSTIDNSFQPEQVEKPKHNTQKIIAESLGWSTGKVAMADRVFKSEKPEIKAAVLSGEKSINEAYKEIKIEEKKEVVKAERERLAEIGKTKKIDVDFRHGDFENVFSDIPDASVDCIITDPPYPYEFIEVWTKLSRFAKRVLKPNGFCITYSGQLHLPEVIARMQSELEYYWTFAVYHEGQTQIVNGVNLMCRWKPVLIFQNGKKKLQNTFQDYFISEQREKNAHEWQQSKSGVAYLIEMFTREGDLICEPFAGGGTTIKAALEKGRSVIAAEIDLDTYNIAKGNL